jgi:hypothetical protein
MILDRVTALRLVRWSVATRSHGDTRSRGLYPDPGAALREDDEVHDGSFAHPTEIIVEVVSSDQEEDDDQTAGEQRTASGPGSRLLYAQHVELGPSELSATEADNAVRERQESTNRPAR